MHFPSEISEHTETEDQYRMKKKKLGEYLEQCKDEALKLFTKCFFHLWG